MPLPIVVFCASPWDLGHRRVQHLMTHLARQRPVIYVEPARGGAPEPHLEESRVAPGITVLRSVVAGRAGSRGFLESQAAAVLALQRRLGLGETCIAWVSTPLAAPLVVHLNPALVVYDCHEDVGENAEAARLETMLLALSDLVFAAGPSLYRDKRGRHANVHCLPPGVERALFARAGGAAAAPARRAARRLGYAGTVDARIDLPLLEALAAQRPNWQVELVGPLVGVNRLPETHNLRYLGARPHAEIPALVSSWDACLLPYVRSPATRYLNPIQVLEYMAAQRPIVSTPLADVMQPYSDVVYFGANADDFVAACQRALYAGRPERERRAAHMREILKGTSWDDTVARVHGLIESALRRRLCVVDALLDAQPATALDEAAGLTAAALERSALGRLACGAPPL